MAEHRRDVAQSFLIMNAGDMPKAPISPQMKAAIARRASQGQGRIERIEIEGCVFWIKRSEGDKTKYWYWLQAFLSWALACDLLRPAASRGGSSALERDAHKLALFRAAGFHVPDLVHAAPGVLVASHIGTSLQDLRGSGEVSKEKMVSLFAKAAEALGRLHAAGLAHGRPLLRDLTWDGERIGFLDLEEQPETVMPLAAAQARDLVLFFVQLARTKQDAPMLPQIFKAYHPYLSPAVREQLALFFRRVSGLIWLFGPLLRRFGGRDGTSAIQALDFLRGALSKSP